MLNKDVFDTDELLALAKMDVEAGRLDLALEKVKLALSSSDEMPELTVLAARIYAQLKLFDKAQAFFDQYLKANPKAFFERFQLGMVYFDSGDRKAAVNCWDKVLEVAPTHPPTLHYAALAKAQLGQVDEAVRDLSVLLESVPVDNLYFNRSKELLQAIQSTNKSLTSQVEPVANPDIYKTEH